MVMSSYSLLLQHSQAHTRGSSDSAIRIILPPFELTQGALVGKSDSFVSLPTAPLANRISVAGTPRAGKSCWVLEVCVAG